MKIWWKKSDVESGRLDLRSQDKTVIIDWFDKSAVLPIVFIFIYVHRSKWPPKKTQSHWAAATRSRGNLSPDPTGSTGIVWILPLRRRRQAGVKMVPQTNRTQGTVRRVASSVSRQMRTASSHRRPLGARRRGRVRSPSWSSWSMKSGNYGDSLIRVPRIWGVNMESTGIMQERMIQIMRQWIRLILRQDREPRREAEKGWCTLPPSWRPSSALRLTQMTLLVTLPARQLPCTFWTSYDCNVSFFI